MATILVLGGGVIGLSTAIMLARQGHDIEHDSEPPTASPEEAWYAWQRRGVTQFRQPHYLHPSVRWLLKSNKVLSLRQEPAMAAVKEEIKRRIIGQ
jgi:hypothetical protein